jgi:antitoxin VapB
MAYAELERVKMTIQRRVSFFRNGRNQAVRIPHDFELPGKYGLMRKEGNRLVIDPEQPSLSLGDWLATLEPLGPDDRMPPIDDFPPEPVDL